MSSSSRSQAQYKVTSLERGLAVLRTLGSVNGPLRNQDVVAQTQLPKATVSRLLNTLAAMGYVRRTDQGGYVPADMSGRAGRAMLAGLRLDRYRDLFARYPCSVGGSARLECRIGAGVVPVYRWTAEGGGLVAHALAVQGASEGGDRVSSDCYEYLHGDRSAVDTVLARQMSDHGWCHRKDASLNMIVASTGVQLGCAGRFVLTMAVPSADAATAETLAALGSSLMAAARQLEALHASLEV